MSPHRRPVRIEKERRRAGIVEERVESVRRRAAANVRGRDGGGLRSPLHRACRRASARRRGRHRPGGSAAIGSVVSCTSLIGTRSRARNCPVVRWLSGSKVRIDSSVSPKKSSRTGLACRAHRDRECRRAPHIRRCRARREARAKPLLSSQATRPSMSTTLPGAAEKLRAAISSRGGTRWGSAFTVVERMRGRSSAVRERARRERTRHPPRRDSPVGRDAIIGLAVPGRKIEDLDLRRGKAQRFAEGMRRAARRARHGRRRPRGFLQPAQARARDRRSRRRHSRRAATTASARRPLRVRQSHV